MGGMGERNVRTAAPDAAQRAWVLEAIRGMARPRLTGSEGAAEVERYLRGELEGLGYEVRELPFSFSTLPARFGVPLAGGVVVVAGVWSAMLAGTRRGGAALVVLLVGVVLVGGLARYGRALVAGLPWGRIRTANWLVTWPGAHPRYLVVAHRDSKSQRVPLLVRAGAIAAGGIVLAALVLLDVLALVGPGRRELGAFAGLVALGCAAVGVVLLLSVVGNDSPGALDNATGVGALLDVARRERERTDVGFLVTDAEELGLAGAAAVARQLPPVHGVFNLDGLDDRGDFHILDRHGVPRRGVAPHLVAALLAAAEQLALPARRRALPVGVLVDHIPLADAGIPAVTLMRGTPASLRRVHRPSDGAVALTGEGAAAGAALVSAALVALRSGSAA